MSTPASTCLIACSLAPASAATGIPCDLPASSIDCGGGPSALAISLIGCLNATSSRLSPASSVTDTRGVWLRVARLDPVVDQQRVDVAPILGGDHVGELLAGQPLPLTDRLLGHDDVDAIRLAAHLGLNPIEFLLKLFRGECHGAEDAEAARIGDSRDHVPTVAERQQWNVDSEKGHQFAWSRR